MADHGLFERMVEAIFPQHPPKDKSINPRIISDAIRVKTIATVQACKEMLAQEPPERMTDFWGTVSCPLLLFFFFFLFLFLAVLNETFTDTPNFST